MKSLRTPLNIFLIYIVTTMLLHFLGPWDYDDVKPLPVIIYMFFVLVFFYVGYISVISKNKIIKTSFEKKIKYNQKLYNYVLIGLYLQIFLIILVLIEHILRGNVSLDGFNPGKNYAEALERNKDLETQTSSITVQIKTILAPLFYFVNIFIIFHFNSLKLKIKIFFFIFILTNIFINMLVKGAQKDIFDIFLIITSVLLLKSYGNPTLFSKFKKISLIGVIFIFFLFAFIQYSRLLAYGATDFIGNDYAHLNRDNFLFDIFGFEIGIGLSILISYISQGYQGLSYCLQLPFEWTFGFGNSFALSGYLEQYLGIENGLENSYPFRMESEYGLDATMYWHTAFPWLASDITFPGVVLLMFFMGRTYAKTLIESIQYSDPLSITLFYFLNVFLIYLPANNQLMQTREMMIGFVVIFVLWMLKRKYKAQ